MIFWPSARLLREAGQEVEVGVDSYQKGESRTDKKTGIDLEDT